MARLKQMLWSAIVYVGVASANQLSEFNNELMYNPIPINPAVASLCDKQLDIFMLYDAHDPNNEFKAQFYDHFTAAFESQVQAGQVQFSYYSKNNDANAQVTMATAYSKFGDNRERGRAAVVNAIRENNQADDALPILDVIIQQVAAMMGYPMGTRPKSTKVCVVVVNENAQGKQMLQRYADEPHVFDTLFKMALDDYGVYVQFVLAPAVAGKLVNLEALLRRHDTHSSRDGYRIMASRHPRELFSEAKLQTLVDSVCLHPYASKWRGRGDPILGTEDIVLPPREFPMTTRYDYMCDEAKYDGADPAHLYAKQFSSERECTKHTDAEFDLTIVTDSTYALGIAGHGYSNNFLRVLFMHLPPCSRYSIIRLNQKQGGYAIMGPPQYHILRETIELLDQHSFWESATQRMLKPMFTGINEFIQQTPIGRPHVTLLITAGDGTDQTDLLNDKTFKKYADSTNFAVVSTTKAAKLLKSSDIGENGFHDRFDSPQDMFNHAGDVSHKIYCMTKRPRKACPTCIAPQSIEGGFKACSTYMDVHFTIDPEISPAASDNFMGLAESVKQYLRHGHKKNMTQIFVNNVLVEGVDGDEKNVRFLELLGNIGNTEFALPDRYYRSPSSKKKPRAFKNFIVMASDKTYRKYRYQILKTMYLAKNSESSSAGKAIGNEYDTLMYLSADVTYRSYIAREFDHPAQKYFDASDKHLVLRYADKMPFSELKELLVGRKGLLCPKKGVCEANYCVNKVRRTCCSKPANPFPPPPITIIPPLPKENIDIAVLVDGAIPAEYSKTIKLFLKQVADGVGRDDIGMDKTRIAVYTSQSIITEPRDDNKWKPWVVGQHHFDTLVRSQLDCSAWEYRACNDVAYRTDGSFNFAKSVNSDSFNANINNFEEQWRTRSGVINEKRGTKSANFGNTKAGSFVLTDINKAVNEVMNNGFTCSKGARMNWDKIHKRLYILVWDYTTLSMNTIELAKLKGFHPVVFFMQGNGDINTALIDCEFGDRCHYNGKSWQSNFGYIYTNNNHDKIYSAFDLREGMLQSEVQFHTPLNDPNVNDKFEDEDPTELYDQVKLEESIGSTKKVYETCDLEMDLILLFDGSASVEQLGWYKQLNFAKEIVKMFDIGEGKTYIGAIQFGNATNTHFDLSPRTEFETTSLIEGLSGEYHNGDGTLLAAAMPKVKSMFSRSKRHGKIPHVLVVLTDGSADDELNLEAQIANLKEHGKDDTGVTEIFAVGVGFKYKEDVLLKMATDVKEGDGVINVGDPRGLRIKLEELNKALCTEYARVMKQKSSSEFGAPLEAVLARWNGLRVGFGVKCDAGVECDQSFKTTKQVETESFGLEVWDREQCKCKDGHEETCFAEPTSCDMCDIRKIAIGQCVDDGTNHCVKRENTVEEVTDAAETTVPGGGADDNATTPGGATDRSATDGGATDSGVTATWQEP